jgi:hypothetical protein
MVRHGHESILAQDANMIYVISRSILALCTAGGIYYYVTTGDVPVWFMVVGFISQFAFFFVKRNFRHNGAAEFSQRVSRKYTDEPDEKFGTLEDRMLAAAEEYKRGTRT